ncbi:MULTISPECIES: hypothetical protein [unclassified Acinetobacter]|uniref:hypothetical protein n=1 Tax=unclassified Acinetobacter TaxID=196816 RepID=UPI0035BA15BA
MALEHGVTLNWQNTTLNKDELYRARDFEVASKNLDIQPTSDIEEYMLEQAKRHQTKDYIASQINLYNGRYLNQIIHDCCVNDTNIEKNNLDKDSLKNNYPSLTEQQISKIDLFKNYLMDKYSSTEAQTLALQKLEQSIPDIANGKIELPDITEPSKDKGR